MISFTITDYSRDVIKKGKGSIQQAVKDCTLDLQGVAIGSAPHDKGTLEKHISSKILTSAGYAEGTVGVSVRESGFDYGQYRHDHPFNLGEQSRRKQGGKSGISGKSFGVGHGFIAYPADANKDAYMKYIDRKFKEALK